MKKEIRVADEEKGIIQVTTYDERWYAKPDTDKNTKLPTYKFVPSVTWVASYYPKGTFFYKWLAEKGWDEAEAIKVAAGNKGSKVHLAIADILLGKEVRIDSKFKNPSTGFEEELTLEEIECIQSFIDWKEENPGEVIAFEVAVFSDKHNFAGTVDFIYKIGEEYWLIDFKTGQSVWEESKFQVSAYRETIINGENGFQKLPPGVDLKLGILQLGYRMNKKRFKFNVIEPDFEGFLLAQSLWKREAGKQTVNQKDYKIVLSAARGEYAVPEHDAIAPESNDEPITEAV